MRSSLEGRVVSRLPGPASTGGTLFRLEEALPQPHSDPTLTALVTQERDLRPYRSGAKKIAPDISGYRGRVGEFDHIVAALQSSPVTAAFVEMAASNDFSRLEKSDAKRHHFVPQFVLRGFSHTYH